MRALWRGEQVLILDEPTSMLTPQGIDELGALMRRLVEQRRGHRLHHPQAAGGGGLRRPHLGAAARPQGRRDPARAVARAGRTARSPEIVGLMFGKRSDDRGSGRGHDPHRAAPERRRCCRSRIWRSAPTDKRRACASTSPSTSGRARSWASPASTATARSSWRRRWRASAGDRRLGAAGRRRHRRR